MSKIRVDLDVNLDTDDISDDELIKCTTEIIRAGGECYNTDVEVLSANVIKDEEENKRKVQYLVYVVNHGNGVHDNTSNHSLYEDLCKAREEVIRYLNEMRAKLEGDDTIEFIGSSISDANDEYAGEDDDFKYTHNGVTTYHTVAIKKLEVKE